MRAGRSVPGEANGGAMVPLNVREGCFRARRSGAVLALLLVTSLPGCAPATKQQSPAEVRSAIEASNKQFTDAFSRRDAAAIGLLYSEDGEVLPPGATPLDGRDAIVTMWQSVL